MSAAPFADVLGGFSTGWLVEALIASSLLMAFVLLARKEAQRALGPQMAYWLWALPALRMALPPLPAAWRETAAAPLSAASETILVLVQPIATATADTGFPWLALVAGAWGLGALAFFAWHGLAHFHYVSRIIAPPARRERLPDGTTLVESDEAVGPVAFGILKRFVAVPSDFAERYDADERKLALAHELGHHARGDLIANWIALAMLAVHWFNPLAWVAYRKFRADQEMANDARVLGALPPIERHAYACAIVKAAHGRAVTAACHLHTIEDLKGRLRMLKASRKSRRVLMAGAVGIAGLTIAGLGLTASGAAAEKLRTVAETQVEAITQGTAAGTGAATFVDANGAVTEHSVREDDRDGKRTRSVRLTIREKDGSTRTYVDGEADAYLKAHPEMEPPAPPAPPAPSAGSGPAGNWAPPAPPVPPVGLANGTSVTTTDDGRTIIRRVARTGPRGYAMASTNVAEVVSGDCRGGNASELVRSEVRNGRTRTVICEKRIERFAAEQARSAEGQARNAELQARRAEIQARAATVQARDARRSGLKAGLAGVEAGRAAIMTAPGMSAADRKAALADLDQARAEIEAEMRSSDD